MAVYRQESYLDRIKAIKSERKITNDKLAEMTGIPLGTLSKLLAGISDSPKLSNIVAISEALDCSLDYLITGVPRNTNNCTLSEDELIFIGNYRLLDGYGRSLVDAVVNMEVDRAIRQQTDDAHRNVSPQGDAGEQAAYPASAARHRTLRGGQDELSATAPAESAAAEPGTASLLHLPGGHGRKDTAKRRRITLYDLPVSAGIGEFLSDAHATEISIPDVAQTVDADFALRIAGDSMEPNYHDGDILLVRRTESVTPGELGIFVLDGCGYFKKFDGDRLLSLNPAYPAEEFHADCLLRSGHRADAETVTRFPTVPNGSRTQTTPLSLSPAEKGTGAIRLVRNRTIGSVRTADINCRLLRRLPGHRKKSENTLYIRLKM